MSMRINIFGRGQGLDGDETTTGAICIAGQARGRVHGKGWLLKGDKTTPCPLVRKFCRRSRRRYGRSMRWENSRKLCLPQPRGFKRKCMRDCNCRYRIIRRERNGYAQR